MKLGIMDGEWIFWYHNGKKELEGKLKDGSFDGEVKLYHDNGLMRQKFEV